jgi:hypothetical protein
MPHWMCPLTFGGLRYPCGWDAAPDCVGAVVGFAGVVACCKDSRATTRFLTALMRTGLGCK